MIFMRKWSVLAFDLGSPPELSKNKRTDLSPKLVEEDHSISQEFIDHSFEILKRFWYLFPSVKLVLLSKFLLHYFRSNTDHI